MPRDTETLATLDDGDALHLILSCRDIRLRVCITSALERTELAFVIPANSMAALRLEAARQLTALQLGNPKAFTRPPFMPTRYDRSEEHTSELESLMRISYAVFCLKQKTNQKDTQNNTNTLHM